MAAVRRAALRRLSDRLREHGLSITLVVLFTFSWGLQTWMGWTEFVAETNSSTAAGSRIRR